MFSTLVAVIALLVLILPGFIVNELASSRRATSPGRGDLDTVLRSLWYSVIVHLLLAASSWTLSVVKKVDDGKEWEQHVATIAIFVLVAVLVLPTILGGLLGARLRKAEQSGTLTTFDYALGGKDSRSSWDYLFGHLKSGFVVLHLKDFKDSLGPLAGPSQSWSTVVGKVSDHSWASQSPSEDHDLWLPEIWPGDETGEVIGEFAAKRGLWVSRSQIIALQVIDVDSPSPVPTGP